MFQAQNQGQKAQVWSQVLQNLPHHVFTQAPVGASWWAQIAPVRDQIAQIAQIAVVRVIINCRASDTDCLIHRLLSATGRHLPGHCNWPRFSFSGLQKVFINWLMRSMLCYASNVLWHCGPFEGEFLSNQSPPVFGAELSGEIMLSE